MTPIPVGFFGGGLVNTAVSPGAGAIVLAGVVPAVVRGSVVAPGAGSIAISGLAPTLAINAALAPGAGTITIAGQTPTVTVVTPTSAWDTSFAAGSGTSYSGGDLIATYGAATTTGSMGTQGYAANTVMDRYFEVTVGGATDQFTVGVGGTTAGSAYPGPNSNEFAYYGNTGQKYTGAAFSSYGATFGPGDVIGVRVTNGVVKFYKNGVSQGTAFDMVAIGFTTQLMWPRAGKTNSAGVDTGTLNTGSSAFFAGLPSGASAWG